MRDIWFPVAAVPMILALLPQTALAGDCDKFDELVTTTPAPPHDARAWQVYSNELGSMGRGDVDLVLVGDSLAEAWDTTMWSPMRVVNLGVGGDRTQHVLWRLHSPKLSRLIPSKVLVMLGTNNLFGEDKPCAIVAGLIKVVERTRTIWPQARIGFLEIPPRGENFMFRNGDRLRVNADMRAVPGVKAIGIDDVVSCKGIQPCVNYADDNLHFSRAGYEVIVGAVKAALYK